MFSPKVIHLRRCRKSCNPHILEYAPVTNFSAPCIWITFGPNTGTIKKFYNFTV